MKKLILILFFFLFSFSSFPNKAIALHDPDSDVIQETESTVGKIINPVLPPILTATPGAAFLQKILKIGILLVLITGSIAFIFILISGGVKWLSSSGDKVKLESAQKQISSGLVGLVILLSSFAVIKLIETLFGIDLLNFNLPTL